jgi:hypothetical protein
MNSMPTPAAEDQLGQTVRTCQIIMAALIIGPLALLAIAAVIGPVVAPQAGAGAGGNAPAPQSPDAFALILTCTAIAFGVLAVCMSFVLPRVMSANGRKEAVKRGLPPKATGGTGKGAKLQTIDEAQSNLLTQFPTQLIVGAAMLEGAAFFAGLSHMLIGGPILLGLAIALICVLVARFPTRARTELWLEHQRERFRDEEFAAGSP